jgi:hypothetical protein
MLQCAGGLCTKLSKNQTHIIFPENIHLGPGAGITPIIPATGEAEIKRIKVQGQPRQKVLKTPSQPIAGRDGICLSPHPRGKPE